MKTLGTVLPTPKSIALTNEYEKQVECRKEKVASETKELAGCVRKVVGGEVRYYDTLDQYAIVSRVGKVLWFAVTEDGDRRIN